MALIFLTSGSTWTVPSNWDSSSNSIECLGGAGGQSANVLGIAYGAAGGGAAYSKITNLTLTPGATININIGAAGNNITGGGTAGDGGDTWFNATSLAASSVGAKGGKGGSSGVPATGGAGGLASSGIGTTKYSGGKGGPASATNASGGGGGSAGPNGNGGDAGYGQGGFQVGGGGGGGNGGGSNGGNATTANAGGAAGGNNSASTGGGAGGTGTGPGAAGTLGGGGGGGGSTGIGGSGGNGSNGQEWDSTHGSGGGGGGGGNDTGLTAVGGNGGGYGAAGGNGVGGVDGNSTGGLIIIQYNSVGTAYTLTPPTYRNGQRGAASGDWTVAPNGTYTGTITLALMGAGLSSPADDVVLTFSGSDVPQTFTLTPTKRGVVIVTPAASPALGTDPLYSSFVSYPTMNIVFQGDSITYGYGASSGLGTTTGPVYPGIVMTELQQGNTFFNSANIGTSGERLDTMLSNIASQLEPLYDGSYDENVLFLMGGTNDLGGGDDGTHSGVATPAQVYANLVSYCTIAQGYGFKVVVLTLCCANYPTYPANFNATRDQYTDLIRNSWSSFCNAMCDMSMDYRMGWSGSEADSTYFISDETHPTDDGYYIIGLYAVSAAARALELFAPFPVIIPAINRNIYLGDPDAP